ncbi:hypothetical protein JCM5350_001068 [Sporobolomyces pararoseus]
MPPRASTSKATVDSGESATAKPKRAKKETASLPPPPPDPALVFNFDPSRVRKVRLTEATRPLIDPGIDTQWTQTTIFEKAHSTPGWFLTYDLHTGQPLNTSSRRPNNVAEQTRLIKTVGGNPDYWCQSAVYDSANGNVVQNLGPQWTKAKRESDFDGFKYWKSVRSTNEVSFRGLWSAVDAPPVTATKLVRAEQAGIIAAFLQYTPPSLDQVPEASLSDIMLYPCFVDRLIRLEGALATQQARLTQGPSANDTTYHYANSKQQALDTQAARRSTSLPSITIHPITATLPVITPGQPQLQFDVNFVVLNNVVYARADHLAKLCFAEPGRIRDDLLNRKQRRAHTTEDPTVQLLWRHFDAGSIELLEAKQGTRTTLREGDRKGQELWCVNAKAANLGLFVTAGYFDAVVDAEKYPRVSQLIDQLFDLGRQRLVSSAPRWTQYVPLPVNQRSTILEFLKTKVGEGIATSIHSLGWGIDAQLEGGLQDILVKGKTSLDRLDATNKLLEKFSQDRTQRQSRHFKLVFSSTSQSAGDTFDSAPKYQCVCGNTFSTLQDIRGHHRCSVLAEHGFVLEDFLDFARSKEIMFFYPPGQTAGFARVKRGYYSSLYDGAHAVSGSRVWRSMADELRAYKTVYWFLIDKDYPDHPELDAFASLFNQQVDPNDTERLRAWKDIATFVAVQAVLPAYYKLDIAKNSGLTPLPMVLDQVMQVFPCVVPEIVDAEAFASIAFHALRNKFGGALPLVSNITSIGDSSHYRPTMLNLTNLAITPELAGTLPSLLSNGKVTIVTGSRHSWQVYETDDQNRVIGYVDTNKDLYDGKASERLRAADRRASLAAQMLRVPDTAPLYFVLDDASASDCPWIIKPYPRVDELLDTPLIDLPLLVRTTEGFDNLGNEIVVVLGGIDGLMVGLRSLIEFFSHWRGGVLVWCLEEHFGVGAGTVIQGAARRNWRVIGARVPGIVWYARYNELLAAHPDQARQAQLARLFQDMPPNLTNVEIAVYDQIFHLWEFEAYKRTNKNRNLIGL